MPITMTNTEIARLLEAVKAHQITAREAIRRLVATGHDEGLAAELVLIALGGSDIIEIGADGVARYESGRTVVEVQADMARTDPIA